MTGLQRWLLTLLVTILAVFIAYQWLDRPIASLAHGQLPYRDVFDKPTHIPDPLIPLALVAFVGLGLWRLSGRLLSKPLAAALVCSISLVMAEAIKNQLKVFFGRTWPDTWIGNNPSFIHDGVYGFNLLHGGAGYMSFPSGHSTLTCAAVTVLWMFYPKLKAIYLAVILALVIGLLGANYHFLSDIIAGAFVGASSGWMAVALWRAREPGAT